MSYDIIVEGKNDPEIDISNLQSAVDNHDNILIKGIFNLGVALGNPYHLIEPEERGMINGPTLVPVNGNLQNSRVEEFWKVPPGTVFITGDCKIVGEEAEILGGYRAFTIGSAPRDFVYDINFDDGHLLTSGNTLNQYAVKPGKVTIQNITFKQNLHSAIWLAATTGQTKLIDNAFFNPIPLVERYWFGSIRSIGIYSQLGLGSLNLLNYVNQEISDMRRVLPRSDGMDSKTGTTLQSDLIIANNQFTSNVGGLLYLIGSAGNITIQHNFTKGGGIGLFGYFGKTIIENNTISSPRPIRNTLRISEDSFGRFHPLTSPANRKWSEGDWERATTIIRNNRLSATGYHPVEIMISKQVELTNNQILVTKIDKVWSAAISLWKTDKSRISKNSIKGSSELGIMLLDSSQNTIKQNNFSKYTPVTILDEISTSHFGFIQSNQNQVIENHSIKYFEINCKGNSFQYQNKIEIDDKLQQFNQKLQEMQFFGTE